MSGGVLVVTEQHAGEWHRMSLETLAAAQQLARELGAEVRAAVPGGAEAEPSAGDLSSKKLHGVFAVRHDLLSDYAADTYSAAIEQLIRAVAPDYVLFPHTYQVRDWAPKVATRFNQSLISDSIGFHVENGAPIFVRQLFQGKLNADVRAAGAGPRFASIQAGSFRADQVEAGTAAVEVFTPELTAARAHPEPPFREAARAVDLSSAELIVSVGRGIREKDNIALVEALAQALGAEVAASRPICDNGWLPMERQVGSSGQTVAPKLYVAIGISGAIQHLVGMKGARTIVAINKDPDAPIFEVADYGIVGDLFEVVPALTDAVKKLRG